jgi:hypothetical protein
MRRRRIDVHQHLVPPRWAAWLRAHGVENAGGRRPYAPAPAVSYFTGQLDAYEALDEAGHRAIDRESAAALLAKED